VIAAARSKTKLMSKYLVDIESFSARGVLIAKL